MFKTRGFMSLRCLKEIWRVVFEVVFLFEFTNIRYVFAYYVNVYGTRWFVVLKQMLLRTSKDVFNVCSIVTRKQQQQQQT